MINKKTQPEIIMLELLKCAKLTKGLVEQHPLKFENIKTIADFAYPNKKVAVFCDGIFWHYGLHLIKKNYNTLKEGPIKDNILKTKVKDAAIHFAFWKNGWVPLRFWDVDIINHGFELTEKVRKHLYDSEFIEKRERQRTEFIKEIEKWKI